MSKLIARIAAVCSLSMFFALIRSPKFWAECEQRAQIKWDDMIRWSESNGFEWTHGLEPDEYAVLCQAWRELHTRFGLRYKDQYDIIGLLNMYYFK